MLERQTRKYKNTVHSLVDVDPSEHFTGYGLGKILVQSIHVLRRDSLYQLTWLFFSYSESQVVTKQRGRV